MADFDWALNELRQGHSVRRTSWRVEEIKAGTCLPGGDGGPDYIVPKDQTRIWHLFLMHEFRDLEFWQSGIINGWGGSVGGAADDDPIRDGMLYTATADDMKAGDWELVGHHGE